MERVNASHQNEDEETRFVRSLSRSISAGNHRVEAILPIDDASEASPAAPDVEDGEKQCKCINFDCCGWKVLPAL
jgi:hypothetical protein